VLRVGLGDLAHEQGVRRTVAGGCGHATSLPTGYRVEEE
jgi:hypothetical protein